MRVSFERIRLDRIGSDGEARMVPFHRAREVVRNVELVWSGRDRRDLVPKLSWSVSKIKP